ncbi:Cytochrome c oxidase assembly protein [Nymphaea thermarum]|nr:Cytochrome c oxidase assembly protein [Nymphaea thermarum]
MSWSLFQRRIALAHSRIDSLNRLFSHSPLGLRGMRNARNGRVSDSFPSVSDGRQSISYITCGGLPTRSMVRSGSSCMDVASVRALISGRDRRWYSARSEGVSRFRAAREGSQSMLLYLFALVVAMVGSTYAAVPLYRKFCQATGYGGTVQRKETVEEKIARHAEEGTTTSRVLTVQFNADVADGMPWKFVPTQREVRVRPGESALAFYTAENLSSAPITGVSTYNVTPMKAAIYFNKIQCFCFEEQRLLPGEQIDMPVFFYIDPEFEEDPKMDGINNLILSYTFFKVSD